MHCHLLFASDAVMCRLHFTSHIMNNAINTATASALSVAHIGPFAELLDPKPGTIPGKRFLSGPVGLTSCEISINRVPAGYGYGFTHRHKRNEEVYIVVGGKGTFYADGAPQPVSEGSVVRVAPSVVRTLEASAETPLDYICIQAPEGGMPYSFADDGVPVSTDVPSRNRLPLPPTLAAFFARNA